MESIKKDLLLDFCCFRRRPLLFSRDDDDDDDEDDDDADDGVINKIEDEILIVSLIAIQ